MKTGAVIIGRNEGERLRRCILSVVRQLDHVVYVDSGSTDGSVELAHELGAPAIALDTYSPFTAARGRNAGFFRLMELIPSTEYVQFIDGDCELIDGWLEAAIDFLQRHPQYAVVCGRLRERHPESSIYNRLCDIEWNGRVGSIEACGGIFMVRSTAFAEIGGMKGAIAAGEEPELCLRLRDNGWLIGRIGIAMAWHDANIASFDKWWKRAVRSGQGSLDVYARTRGKVFAAQVKRTRRWTIGWMVVLLCVLGTKSMIEQSMYILIVLSVFALYPLQILRIALRMRGKGLTFCEAFVYGGLMMIGKWAELYGHFSNHLLTEERKTQ